MVMMKCSCMHLLMVLATIQALYGTVLMQGEAIAAGIPSYSDADVAIGMVSTITNCSLHIFYR